MKTENERYEQWLETLKSNAPVLENPTALTEDILRRVASLPPRNRPKRGWEICGWISAVAAGILLCLLINDTIFFEKEALPTNRPEIYVQTQDIQLKGQTTPEGWSVKMNLMEKSRCLSEVWNKRQEKRKKETAEMLDRVMEIMNNQSFNK